ncbi:MAG: PQQ-like beta-propeller repeat protein [Nannocystaceae bacterium]|nr:PQQ-like beta-propeller repeat protein [Nannocystaceae bacterium]
MMLRHAAMLALVLGTGACARVLPAQAPAHGSLRAEAVVAEGDVDAPAAALPLVVMVERDRVVAVDPIHGRTRWSLPLVVTGHPVASAYRVILPVRGQQLVVVDRDSGAIERTLVLPGEALTGVAIAEPWIVATVLEDRPGVRGQIMAFSTEDGDRLWRRDTAAPLGVPEVAGDVAVVPAGEQIVALRLRSGRELARLDVEAAGTQGLALERVAHRRGAWFAGAGTRWVDLGGETDATHELLAGHDDVFHATGRIDVGHSDDERVRLWLRWSDVDATPRDAMVLARRAVVAMRLDGQGQPLRGRWVHSEDEEIVAMEVLGDRVVLAREDGAIVVLDDSDGRVVRRIGGGEPIRGALVLGAPPKIRRNPRLADSPRVTADLHRLLQDPDPRLLPVQRIAADLLWRDDDVEVRRTVLALARGQSGPHDAATDAADTLQAHAQRLIATRWGSASREELAASLAQLRRRPAFGRVDEDFTPLVQQTVRSAQPEVTAELTALLLHPGTSTDALVGIVDALGAIDDAAALAALTTFVQRYHADAIVATESRAVQAAATIVLRFAAGGSPAGVQARTALRAIADDPLTEPALRTVIVRGLASLPADGDRVSAR